MKTLTHVKVGTPTKIIVDIMSSVEVTKQIHKDIDQPLKNLSINHQETLLKETHNIIESLRTIEKISKKSPSLKKQPHSIL